MSEWSDRITGHAAIKALRNVQAEISNAEPIATEMTETIEPLARLKTVVDFALARIDMLDPELVLPGPLDNMNASVNTILSNITNFTSSRNASYLVSANAQADSVLQYLVQLGTFQHDKEVDGVREAVVTFRRAVSQHLRYVESDVAPLKNTVAGLTKQLSKLSEEITNQRNQLATLTSEYQSQFSTAQEKRLAEFAEAQTERADEAAETEASRAEEFRTTMEAFAERTETIVEEAEARHKKLDEDARAAMSALEAEHGEQAAALVKKIAGDRDEAQKLLGIIGNVGITSGYQKTANEARWIAAAWQILAVLAMGGLILVAYEAFLPAVKGTFTWESFAGRVFVSLTVGVLAAYSAHQASRSQDLERRNRKTALELESLGPYLASLPEQKQEDFRLLMADRTFGRDEPVVSKDHAPATVADLVKSKELREFILDIVKSIK